MKSRILVIDDNSEIHEDIKKILRFTEELSELDELEMEILGTTIEKPPQISMVIDSALQGEQGVTMGLKAWKEGKPYALAFVDVRMPPGMNGIETIKKIREFDKNLQFVIITAYSDYNWDEINSAIDSQGNLLILKKPFDFIEIRQLASALTDKWMTSRESRKKSKTLEKMNQALQSEIVERKKLVIRQKEMIANISDVIAIMDSNGIIKYKSPNIEKWFGWNPEDLIDTDGWATVHPDDLERIQKEFSELLDKENSVKTVEYKYKCKDGSYKLIELTAVNLTKNSIINGLLMNYHDITERYQAVEALKKNEKRFRDITHSMADWIWEVDKNGKYIYVSDTIKNILGFSPEELIGKTPFELMTVEEGAKISEIFSEIVTKSRPIVDLENWNIAKNGTEVCLLTSGVPIINPDGEFQGYRGVDKDITLQKKLEEKNLLIEAQLRQAQKMEAIGTLAGGIAHDFNNILFPILGHTEMLLLEDMPEDSSLKDSLGEIHTGALRAKDLVRQILTFSRQATNELILMKIQPIAKEVLKFIRSTIPTTIDIKSDISNDCGIIKADPTQIHQVIMNLTTNAYHAMEDTGGKLKVSLKKIELCEHDIIMPDMTPGVYTCLTVADTGVGMDKDLKKNIFDPFFTTKEKGKGTGMGLSVVHGIVKSMGGAIQVYSELGKGTEFKIYFPIEKSSFDKQSIQMHETIQGGIERILLIDDEDAIITMEKLMLERLGYRVTSHTSSFEALEAFRAAPEKFDLVITDMAMPNIPGDRLAVELTKIHPNIPILLCTGFRKTISEAEAASLGIRGFLMKPIVMTDFAKKIREVLDEKMK